MEVTAAVGVSVGAGIFAGEAFATIGTAVSVEGAGAEGEAQEVMRNIKRKKSEALNVSFDGIENILPPLSKSNCCLFMGVVL